MAKLYVSSILVACIGVYLMIACFGPQVSEAVPQEQDDLPKFGYGARILENAFNPVMSKMIRAGMDLVTELTQIASSLSKNEITKEVEEKLMKSLESIDAGAKTVKLQYSLLLGILLWPLALLICPIGCCLACLVCCIVGTVTVVVVGLLLIVGTILYSGPILAGMLPHEATHVVGSLVDTLASVSNETLDAVNVLIGQGHSTQAAPVVEVMQLVVSAFGGIGHQLKQVLAHPNLSGDLSKEVYAVLVQVYDQLNALGVQTENLVKNIPGSCNCDGLNATLAHLGMHIKDVVFKLNY